LKYLIDKYTQIGENHSNHNEDFLITQELGSNKVLIAVMDGCSNGTDSYLASTIIGKLLRKIAIEIDHKDDLFPNENVTDLKVLSKEILQKLFNQMIDIKIRLFLKEDEMFSTLSLAIVNYRNKTAEIVTIGDGLVCCNGVKYSYEQENDKPDYIAYHFGENFEDWYINQTQRISLIEIKDLIISTDGIYLFDYYNERKNDFIFNKSETVDYLLDINQSYAINLNIVEDLSISKKVKKLEKEYGLKPSDDIAIIKIML